MRFWKRFYPALFALALGLFSVYALLDTFVIERVYRTAETPTAALTAAETIGASPSALSAANTLGAAGVLTESGYRSSELTIELADYRWNDTDIHVADVTFSDPSALKTAFSAGSYGRNITAATSETAADVGAILAVNGDNYGAREKGYVIRGGVLYRDTAVKGQEDLVIWDDGSASIIVETEISARELLAQGAREVFSFGPGLLSDGEILVSEADEVGRAKASNPRTAIGFLGEGHIVLVVSDGRTEESAGLSLRELAEFMQTLGAETAYNLDGGGSSTMVFNGGIVNTPVGGRGDRERAVTDILYFGEEGL